MKKTNHLLFDFLSSRFLLEQKEWVFAQIEQQYGLPHMESRDVLYYLEGSPLPEELRQNIERYKQPPDFPDILENDYFEMLDFKIQHDPNYRGFISAPREFHHDFLVRWDSWLQAHQQPPSQMIFAKNSFAEQLAYCQKHNLIVIYDDALTPEEMEQFDYNNAMNYCRPYQAYYQTHQRYHEIDLDNKTAQEIYEAVSEIIEQV